MKILSFFLNNNIGGNKMTFKYRYRKQIFIIVSLLIIIISITTTIILLNNEKEEVLINKDNKKEPIKKKKIENKEVPLLSVDIKGEVNIPGIYSLKESSRVIDVISQAGGLTENADTSVINLSKKIVDEMVIIVYSREQVANFKQTKELEKYLQEKCNKEDENALINGACITNENNETNLININTASLEELIKIPGIGEKKAQDIIDYRNQNGSFNTIEDIKNISGIGDSLFDKIKENITV